MLLQHILYLEVCFLCISLICAFVCQTLTNVIHIESNNVDQGNMSWIILVLYE